MGETFTVGTRKQDRGLSTLTLPIPRRGVEYLNELGVSDIGLCSISSGNKIEQRQP